jgi:hypothetical protein
VCHTVARAHHVRTLAGATGTGGVVRIGILCLQLAWNDFLFAAVLTNNATQTLPVMMAAFSAGDSGMDWGGLTAAMAMISSVKFPNVALSNPPIAGLGFELRPPVAERLERNRNRPRLPAPPQLNNEGDRSRATKIRQLHPLRTPRLQDSNSCQL